MDKATGISTFASVSEVARGECMHKVVIQREAGAPGGTWVQRLMTGIQLSLA